MEIYILSSPWVITRLNWQKNSTLTFLWQLRYQHIVWSKATQQRLIWILWWEGPWVILFVPPNYCVPFHIITLHRCGSISAGWLPGKEHIVLVDVRYLEWQRRSGTSHHCSCCVWGQMGDMQSISEGRKLTQGWNEEENWWGKVKKQDMMIEGKCDEGVRYLTHAITDS